MSRTTIKDQINRIAQRGGMAMSNGFAIKFNLPDGLQTYVDSVVPDADIYEGFCDEASLPSAQAATGQTTGKYLGEGQVSYPHTKLYTDFQLGWMADANMEPYKFLNAWWQYIFKESDDTGPYGVDNYFGVTTGKTYSQMMSIDGDGIKARNRTTRLRFPESYTSTIQVAKVEKGPRSDTDRVSMVHVLQDAYPYSVEQVPLSFGGSTLVKVTGNFYYSKHYVVYNKDTSAGMGTFMGGLLGQLLDTNNDGNLNLPSGDIT